MIISASRRTDIPAFYLPWLFNRLAAGFVMTRNPINPKQVRRVELTSAAVDCIIFWSKNPAPLLARLEELEKFGIPFGLGFTLNAYGFDLEPGVPPLQERISTFRALARRLGAEKLVWRYDPIAFSPRYDAAFHRDQFRRIADELAPCTRVCITSFLDFYARTRRNLAGTQVREPGVEECRALASELASLSSRRGIRLAACAESGFDLPPAACIGREWVSAICGHEVEAEKDPGQRKLCNCLRSLDIGETDSCPHGCLYCYANRSPRSAKRRAETAHHPSSLFLCSSPA